MDEIERLRASNEALLALSEAGVSPKLGLPYVLATMEKENVGAAAAVSTLQRDASYSPIFGKVAAAVDKPISDMTTSQKMALIDRLGLDGFKARLLDENG